MTTVPIITVITKCDLYIASLRRRAGIEDTIRYQSAEGIFEETFGHRFDNSNISRGQMPYALVSGMFMSRFLHLDWHLCAVSEPEALRRLVKITMESIRAEIPGRWSRLARGRSYLLDRATENNRFTGSDSVSAQIALAAAQGVDVAEKIGASIK